MRSEEIEQLYQHDLFWNMKWMERLREEKNPQRIIRVTDSYFKFILKGEVLREVGQELVKMYFHNQKEASDIFSAGNEIQIAYRKRTYDLDIMAHVFEGEPDPEKEKRKELMQLAIEMQKSPFGIGRFLVYWGAMAATKITGLPTDELEPQECLLVVLSCVGSESCVKLDTTKWHHCWKAVPVDTDDDRIIGNPYQKGINTLVIDLNRFKQQVTNPRTILDFYFSFLMCETDKDIKELLDKDHDGIMVNIIRADAEFLENDLSWDVYMSESKTELSLKKAQLDLNKANAEIKEKDEAIKAEKARADKAEADLAQFKADSDAKMAEMQAEIDRLKAGKKD